MTPPFLYRLVLGVPLTLIVLVAALTIKVCNWIVWWRWEDVDIGGAKIL